MNYFFDTYAMVEFIGGNEIYINLFKEEGITTRLNLMELYYQILKRLGKKIAKRVYTRFLSHAVDFDDNTVMESMEFRLRMRKKGKKFSYVDTIGYIVAKRAGVEFLTGDEEFKGLPNVKFVK